MVIIIVTMKTIAAGEFKAKCLQIMDEVDESGEAVIITKRGVAVAKLVPVFDKDPNSHLRMHGREDGDRRRPH